MFFIENLLKFIILLGYGIFTEKNKNYIKKLICLKSM